MKRVYVVSLILLWIGSFYVGTAAFGGSMCAQFCGAKYSDATPQSESRAGLWFNIFSFPVEPLTAIVQVAMNNGDGFMWDWPSHVKFRTLPRDTARNIWSGLHFFHFNGHQWRRSGERQP